VVTAEAVRTELGTILEPRDPSESVTVLGAGSDDLVAGRAYLSALAEGGWMVPTWPAEYGGRGASVDDAAVIARELARFAQPDLYPFLVGVSVVAPTLLACATPEQCARWLPAIRSGEEIWCQLFSEPGAGSDLAGLATRAEPDGDLWRVTGQKVWSSRAHYAQWGFLLARTDPSVPKHSGISAFAIRMDTPGLEIRPLRQMNGDAHFSEVFLDGAVAHESDRIGEVGGGWHVARTALANERGAVGAAGTGLGSPAERLLALLDERGDQVDAAARDRVMATHVASEVNRLTTRRARGAAEAGRTPGPEGSGAKLRGAMVFKETASAALSLLGPAGALSDGEWATLFLTAPSISIRGGTDEIQRNIVGERVLGLPPEPRTDVDLPWDEIPH
jgi:alkylation response protein AidB-like acyl-CoA dehydrogenase